MSSDKAIPKEIDQLREDLIWAKFDVSQYNQLFAGTEKRSQLLVKVADVFFLRLHQFYWDCFTLAISRFTDKVQQGANENLSVFYLSTLLDLLSPNRRKTVEDILNALPDKARKFREHRSKNLAHRDLLRATASDLEPDILRLSEVEDVLNDVAKCLSGFYLELASVVCNWEMQSAGDVSALVYYLKQGVLYDELSDRRNNPFQDAAEAEQSEFNDA